MRGKSKTTPVLLASGILTHPQDNKPILIETKDWYSWLEQPQTFYYEGQHIGFTIRPEKRRRSIFWYAFKKITGKTRKKYIGHSESISLKALQAIESEWHLLFENITSKEQVTQRLDFPNHILDNLFGDEKLTAYQAWENPENRYRARAGLYLIRHENWLYEIQFNGKKWQIFAHRKNTIYTEELEFDSLKTATYIASQMKPH